MLGSFGSNIIKTKVMYTTHLNVYPEKNWDQ